MYELPGVGPRPMVRISQRYESHVGDPEQLITQHTFSQDNNQLKVTRVRADNPNQILTSKIVDTAAYDDAVVKLPYLARQPLSAALEVGDIAIDLLGHDAIVGSSSLGETPVVRMIARANDTSAAANAIRKLVSLAL